MTFKLTGLVMVISLLVAQSQSCQTSETSEKSKEVREIFSLDSKVEMLFFFKKDSSKVDREEFYENVLNQPHPGGGYWPRSGVKATFGIHRDGYEGFGFLFFADASEQNKEDLRRLLLESTLIYRVYENVVPNEIDDLKPPKGVEMK
jgi:hypothetical protein